MSIETICAREKCTGCTACYSICHTNAIEMCQDEWGYIYPDIHAERCTGCKLCVKICPVLNNSMHRPINRAYAVYSKDHTDRVTSSSGGAASAFSQQILTRGGVVYGCSAINCRHIRHVRVENREDLYQLKGSKYVQSDVIGIFTQLKKDLKENREVLFIGTPCQVAGVKSFLRKNYINLYTIDLICHGVPSQQLLNDNIKYYSGDVPDEAKMSFRRKQSGKENIVFGFYMDHAGKRLISADFPKDPYIAGFIWGLFYRSSCYECIYATSERVGDITLGDFWGLGKEIKSDIENTTGTSAVLINTEKGESLFQNIKQLLVIEERPVSEAVQGNGQLMHPSKKSEYYTLFRQLYIEKGYDESIRACLKREYKTVFRKQLIKKIRAGLSRVPLMKRFYYLMKRQKK